MPHRRGEDSDELEKSALPIMNYRGREVSSDGNVQKTHWTQMRIRIGSTYIPDPERATLSSWCYSDQCALLPSSALVGPEITVNEMEEEVEKHT